MIKKEYFCNKCGKKMDLFDIQEQFHFADRLGYGTKHDGDYIELDLCCDCMDALIDSCKINPVIED